jgi:hypothetical protein
MEYAYCFVDLHANGVLGESGYPSVCNLDNAIYPIWRRENFRAGNIEEGVRMLKMGDSSWDESLCLLDQRVYQRMEPGLRLASLLLTQSGPFFSQLIYGQLQIRQVRRLQPLGTPDEWRTRVVNILRNPRHSPELIAEELEEFADRVAENSLTYFPDDVPGPYAWGEARTTLHDQCRYAIGIGSSLADVICQPQWHRTNAQSRRYYNFQLAVTLVHELAHVAWRYRPWDELLEEPESESDEVIMSPSEEQIELDQSWETWFFGGELRPIDTFETPPRWLGFAFGPFTIDSGNEESLFWRDCRFGGTAIPAWCINQFSRSNDGQLISKGVSHFRSISRH